VTSFHIVHQALHLRPSALAHVFGVNRAALYYDVFANVESSLESGIREKIAEVIYFYDPEIIRSNSL
jgi:hypothetical protein